MTRNQFDRPIRLDERRFTVTNACRLSGAVDADVWNWLRPEGGNPLGIGERDGRGRRLLHLLDVVKLAAMHDITRRAGVRPSDAAGAAVLVARQIEKMAPRDEYGSPLVDLQSLPQTLYLGLASVDGEMQVGLIDPFRPAGYLDVGGPSAAAHIVVPIAALLATVAGRVIGALT